MTITSIEFSSAAQAWAEQALRAQAAEQQVQALIKENTELKKQLAELQATKSPSTN